MQRYPGDQRECRAGHASLVGMMVRPAHPWPGRAGQSLHGGLGGGGQHDPMVARGDGRRRENRGYLEGPSGPPGSRCGALVGEQHRNSQSRSLFEARFPTGSASSSGPWPAASDPRDVARCLGGDERCALASSATTAWGVRLRLWFDGQVDAEAGQDGKAQSATSGARLAPWAVAKSSPLRSPPS